MTLKQKVLFWCVLLLLNEIWKVVVHYPDISFWKSLVPDLIWFVIGVTSTWTE